MRTVLRPRGHGLVPRWLLVSAVVGLLCGALPSALPQLPSEYGGSVGLSASTAVHLVGPERGGSPVLAATPNKDGVSGVKGGLAGTALPALTWSNLSAVASGTGPSPREGAAMAYDPKDGYVVLFGGSKPSGAELGDTWTYHNGTWANLTASLSSSPSPRSGAGMSWDPSSTRLVLFGGQGASGSLLNDTWVFSGGSWTNVTSALLRSPPPTYAPSLTTDSADGAVILFGGAWAKGAFGQTWEWRGSGWTNLTGSLTVAPAARLWVASADDPWDAGVLVFGGYDDNATYFSDTWLFHAGTWTNLTPGLSISPGRLIEASLLQEGGEQGLVLAFGSSVSGGGVPSENPSTWVWRSGKWVNASATVSNAPALRDLAGQATVPYGGGDGVVFGGVGGTSDLSDVELLHLPLDANASVGPTPVPLGTAVRFNAQIVGGVPPVAVRWDLGDGTVSTIQNGTHTYVSPGTYAVAFLTTDSLGAAIFENFSVRVVSGLAVTATASPGAMDLGMPTSFSSTVLGGSPPFSYAWDFGDGNTSTGTSPTHDYGRTGVFTVRLSVTDTLGTSGSAWANVTVASLPTVTITDNPSSASIGQSVQFSSSVFGGTRPITFSWALGDGSVTTSPNATHAYAAPGRFTVALEVTDALGRSSNASVILPVTSTGSPLMVVATALPSQGNTSTSFVFNATASGGSPPYTFVWSLGDGSTAAGRQVTHKFARGRTAPYNVTANVTDLVGDRSEVSLQVLVSSVPTTSPGGGTSQHGGGGWLTTTVTEVVLAAVGVLVAVVAAALFLSRKRKRQREGSKEGARPPPDPSEESAAGAPP